MFAFVPVKLVSGMFSNVIPSAFSVLSITDIT